MEWVWILCINHVIEVLTNKLTVAELNELITHCCSYDIECIGEVLLLNSIPSYIKLETTVTHSTYVHESSRKQIWWNSHVIITQEVLLCTIEVVERTEEVTIEQRPIKSDVPVLTLLPVQVIVWILTRTPYLIRLTIIHIITKALHCVK